MKRSYIFIAFIAFVILVGCSTTTSKSNVTYETKVTYDYDVEVDFAELKSFDWLPMTAPSEREELLAKRVKRAVNERLQSKGYALTSDNPDFLIAILGRTNWKIDRGEIPGESSAYQEGTLVLGFLDPKTQKGIWKSKATRALDPTPTPEEQERNIRRVVSRMLRDFPPHR